MCSGDALMVDARWRKWDAAELDVQTDVGKHSNLRRIV